MYECYGRLEMSTSWGGVRRGGEVQSTKHTYVRVSMGKIAATCRSFEEKEEPTS